MREDILIESGTVSLGPHDFGNVVVRPGAIAHLRGCHIDRLIIHAGCDVTTYDARIGETVLLGPDGNPLPVPGAIG